jgi:hypothetical protein
MKSRRRVNSTVGWLNFQVQERKMNLRKLVLLSIAIAITQQAVSGQTRASDPSVESLRGLKGISVIVDRVQTLSLPVDSKPDTPSKEEVQAEAELWLKKLGINVVATPDQKTPSLHLVLLAEKENGRNHYDFTVRLMQEVTLSRDPSVKVQAPTWTGIMLGSTGTYKPFEDLVCNGIVQFVMAYNSVNAPEKISYVDNLANVCSQ